ncbi:hypothetical protein HOS53_gp003 [Klebsiella phage May]|uniref:Uncharacterized protein n=1 Tax=Klebsiella phage May TaxID=2054272 RepID=A0A2H5BNL6_9CAUD|nr:hypothetical protein HOS53_gp003 [Klebsiella phage May]AUG87924.1 hypothetical protein CPT_May_003 [Klebsiella phage May]
MVSKKTLVAIAMAGAVISAEQALARSYQESRHRGDDIWYSNNSGPGTPGHGRPSVKRPKKAKTHGKNKRKSK